jgi:hypothetical protein
MKAELKHIYSPDIPDLLNFTPDDEDVFGFILGLLVGPNNDNSSELFTATVCTPSWLYSHYNEDEIVWGRHHIFMHRYDYEGLVARIKKYLQTCNGENWSEVAKKVGNIALWEFEGSPEGS